jgi:hypothetical protein
MFDGLIRPNVGSAARAGGVVEVFVARQPTVSRLPHQIGQSKLSAGAPISMVEAPDGDRRCRRRSADSGRKTPGQRREQLIKNSGSGAFIRAERSESGQRWGRLRLLA